MGSLEKLLIEYNQSDYYGFHMPGHKRNEEFMGNSLPYGMDITEIEGFDDLHHSEEILLEAQKRAAKVFKAEESFYLINGSTSGNLAGIMAVTNPGDKVLIARNNHKSIYNGVYLRQLRPVFIYPELDRTHNIMGEISKDEVKCILMKEKDIKAIAIVSPTYDGVVSDVKGIAEVAHEFGIPLIVDEAHGAHFSMHEYFPKNANELGADIVVHSVHKTLPSLTQTGLLHVNGSIVDRDKVRRYLKIVQSSSPSYILMASIDACVNVIEEKREEIFSEYVVRLDKLRSHLNEMKKLRLVETENYDKSKIVISTKNRFSSKELYQVLLDKYHLQMEMCGADYVTAMTSVCDTQEGFNRLLEALLEIDSLSVVDEVEEDNNISIEMIKFPELQQADENQRDNQDVSEWFYYVYPPGIPFVVPGDIITVDVKAFIDKYENLGFKIHRG